MAQTRLTINGRSYDISCEPGQEGQLQKLGKDLDERARALVQAIGQVHEPLLLVMVGLFLADELNEAKAGNVAPAEPAVSAEEVEAVEKRLKTLLNRLSTVAESLESP